MPELRKLQLDFLEYLTNSSTVVMDIIEDQGNIDRKARLDIYQNAYKVRLKSCIESDHPILAVYLGDDLFEQMAAGYIKQNPSCYTSLRHFCDRLPEYLRQNEPFKSHPIIAEIASFERILLDAFDAADSSRAGESELQDLPTEKWPGMKLAFHPSVQVFEASWNSVECWQALKNDKTPPESMKQQNWWVIWRNRERLTEYRSLSLDGFVLYSCLADSFNFADACELLMEHLPEDQIGPASVSHLMNWFQLGIVRSLVY